MRWRKRKDEDWLDCQSTAWLQGYDDGYAGEPADPDGDGRAHPQPLSENRNYIDGFVTGQTERESEAGR